MSERQRARLRITAGVLLASALGWMLHLGAAGDATGDPFCRGGGGGWSWSYFGLLLDVSGLGSLAAAWLLMLIAMMAPTLVAPLLHVHQRSFARRRGRSITLFLAGYGAVWMLAGAALTLLQLSLALIAPQSVWPALAAIALALVWQCSPAKQLCLNRSHNHHELAAFGYAADRDALGFGLRHGLWCIGSCWALMLVPMLWVQAHVATMLAATVLMSAERLEGPRPLIWKLRGLGKLMRIARIQLLKLRVERAATGCSADASRPG